MCLQRRRRLCRRCLLLFPLPHPNLSKLMSQLIKSQLVFVIFSHAHSATAVAPTPGPLLSSLRLSQWHARTLIPHLTLARAWQKRPDPTERLPPFTCAMPECQHVAHFFIPNKYLFCACRGTAHNAAARLLARPAQSRLCCCSPCRGSGPVFPPWCFGEACRPYMHIS